MKKRIIALIMCTVMLFSTAAVPASAVSLVKKDGIIDSIENGYTMKNLGDILKGIYQIRIFLNNLTGVPIFSEEKFVVTVDDSIQGIINYIIDKTGVDFGDIFFNIPALDRGAEIITSSLRINIPVLQKQLKKTADLFRDTKPTVATLLDLMRIWFGLVDVCQIKLTPVKGRPGVYRFDADITYRDGRKETATTNIVYNENTKTIEGMDGGPALLGFSVDLDQMVSYTGIDVWQRHFGFCVEYDLFCFLTPYIMNYVTQRIKFIYDNREWMCQIWKGTYFITNGGEVGFYTRPIGSLGTFYKCAGDDDMLTMSLDVYHKDKLLLHRGPLEHWWVTGFAVDDTCYVPATLTLVTTITMKDKEMFDAFTNALKKKWYALDYETNGLDVTITW